MLHGDSNDLLVQLNNVCLVPRSSQPEPPPNSLLCLPSDVIVVIFDYLTVDVIYCLSLVCRHLNDLVTKFGWTAYLRSNPRASLSLSCIDKLWTPYERVRYNTISDRNWNSQNFVARPLSASWRGKLRPQLAISRTRLVVAAGSNLNVYSFSSAPYYADAPAIRFEATYSIRRSDTEPEARHDVTGIAFLPDNGEDQTLLAGFADGYVMRVTLPDARKTGLLPSPDLETLYIGEDRIESLSVSNNLSFSLSSLGKGILRDIAAGTTCEINVDEKSWSSYISSAGAPYVAIGASSTMPLAIYPIKESSLSSLPSLAFSSIRASDSANRTPASAVYGITGPPPSFPGNPGQIVVSGWFDGRVRLYDLRIPPVTVSSFTTPSGVKAIPLLSPIITLSDPWAMESIYTVSTGGGSGYTVAAGAARHSVVSFWDVRAPRAGWSVHAPGNDTSPVYAVALESSRLFGTTQSRAFVCDFGPGVGVGTYPALPRGTGAEPRNRRGLDDALRTDDSVSYAVTKYLHRNPLAGG